MMWKKFQMPAEYLKQRADDSSFKRWAQRVGEGEHKHSVYMRGFASDEGVVANLGRDGAAMGPEHFRKAFYKMPATVDIQIMDEGDFIEGSLSLTESHDWVRKNGPKNRYSLNVSVGGGHDWAAVDFDLPSMQIIHIDTHLDVRPCNSEILHSGSPFHYLVSKGAKVWNFGAQPEYHSPEQWNYAMSKFQGLWSLDDLEADFHKALDRCFTAIDPLKPLGLSVDLDAFPQAISPGVSAPSPRGISLEHAVKIIDAIAKNLTHVGFYELNPHFDYDEQSSRLGAFLLSRLLQKKFS